MGRVLQQQLTNTTALQHCVKCTKLRLSCNQLGARVRQCRRCRHNLTMPTCRTFQLSPPHHYTIVAQCSRAHTTTGMSNERRCTEKVLVKVEAHPSFFSTSDQWRAIAASLAWDTCRRRLCKRGLCAHAQVKATFVVTINGRIQLTRGIFDARPHDLLQWALRTLYTRLLYAPIFIMLSPRTYTLSIVTILCAGTRPEDYTHDS